VISWRFACRQCGARPGPGRAWCRRCLRFLAYHGVTDIDEFLTFTEVRAMQQRDPSPFDFDGGRRSR